MIRVPTAAQAIRSMRSWKTHRFYGTSDRSSREMTLLSQRIKCCLKGLSRAKMFPPCPAKGLHAQTPLPSVTTKGYVSIEVQTTYILYSKRSCVRKHSSETHINVRVKFAVSRALYKLMLSIGNINTIDCQY